MTTASLPCPKCGSALKSKDRFCPWCGTAAGQSAPEEPGARLEARLAQRMAELETRLSGRARTAEERIAGGRSGRETERPERPLRQNLGAKLGVLAPQEILGLAEIDPAEAYQAAGLVLNSKMVHGNPLYQERLAPVTFLFLGEETGVNAFATKRPELLPDGSPNRHPAIAMLGGLAMANTLAATAMALFIANRADAGRRTECRDLLTRTVEALGEVIKRRLGRMPPENYVGIFEALLLPLIDQSRGGESERFVPLAQSIRLSMAMAVVAHEAGHIALGHTVGDAANFEISRNQEREADSFASSVLSASPYLEYHFLGQALQCLVFVWLESRIPGGATTHPHSRERFNNIFASNSRAAQEAERMFGVTRAIWEELLPKA